MAPVTRVPSSLLDQLHIHKENMTNILAMSPPQRRLNERSERELFKPQI